MDKNRDEKGRFVNGHKTNVGKKNALGTHHRKPESFRRMRSEKMKGNKITLGRRHSEETKRKISEIKKGTNKGERNPNWKGGVSFDYRQGYPKQQKIWAKILFKRDGYKCLICKKVGGKLNAHHIKSWKEYPKLKFDINNGITLCDKCHRLTHKRSSKIMVSY